MTSSMLYLHTLSPLHCGSGQGSGVIDMPVVRETTTNWPEIPGSTVKGVLRDACRDAGVESNVLDIVFGPDISSQNGAPSDHSGGLWLPGAQLLSFPVRSFRGTFAWLTCGHALRRWLRDCQHIDHPLGLSAPLVASDESILLTNDAAAKLAIDETVLLEDLDLKVKLEHAKATQSIAEAIAKLVFPEDPDWQAFFAGHFGIVSDDVFGFLTRTATDVRARVRIEDDRKTVADGQLWYEETVPMETIFSLPLRSTKQGEQRLAKSSGDYASLIDVIAQSLKTPVQFGGNATVGNGLVMGHLGEAVSVQQEVANS